MYTKISNRVYEYLWRLQSWLPVYLREAIEPAPQKMMLSQKDRPPSVSGKVLDICSVTVDVPFITQFHLRIIVCAKCTKLIASFKENFVERKKFGLVFGSFCGIFRDTMKNIDSTTVYVRVEKNRANSLIWADALFCSTVFYGSAVL